MWVGQQPCRNIGAQRWKITENGNSYTITSMDDIRYVLGISNRPYYGSKLIELQLAAGTSAQRRMIEKSA